MTGPRHETFEHRGLTRRDFLTKGARSRLAALLGGEVAAADATMAEGTEQSDPTAILSPQDLRPLTRDAVIASIERIRAQRRMP